MSLGKPGLLLVSDSPTSNFCPTGQGLTFGCTFYSIFDFLELLDLFFSTNFVAFHIVSCYLAKKVAKMKFELSQRYGESMTNSGHG